MRIQTKNIVAALLFFLPLVAEAQEKQWTLQECMRYAIQNSPRKNSQEAQNSIYKQNYTEAVGRLLPSLDAGTNAYVNFGRSVDYETNTYTNVNAFSNDYGVWSSLTLFDGMASISRLKFQKMNRLMGTHELEEIKYLIAYETMEAFFKVLYQKEMVKFANEQLAESTGNLKQVQRMGELGLKGFPDVAEMQAKEAADNYELTRQKNLLTISVIELKAKMNFPVDEAFDIIAFDTEALIGKADETALEIYNRSLTYLPKALAAKASLSAKELSYKVAKGGLSPTISASASFGTGYAKFLDQSWYSSSNQLLPYNTQLRDKKGYQVGFALSIPIFDGFSRSSSVKRAKQDVIIAENKKEETLRSLYSEIEQAVADMNGQADEYCQAKKQVEAMSVAYDVNRRKYNEGLINAIELHTSSNKLLKARIEEVNARLMFHLKQKLVNYYKGESFVE